MPWKNTLYFVVAATLTAVQLCDGQVLIQNPPPHGGVQFRGAEHEPAAPTRRGSLTFRSDEQTDQKSTAVLHSLMDAKLKRMDPSVQCSDNSMTLKVKQVRAPHFLVDSGEGPLTPLAQMPSTCGFSVTRSRRDVHFAASYQGCHVAQQGGDYVLPLRLWGAPMTMSCPAVLPPPSVSCFPTGMVVKIGGITANELKVKVSGTWKPLSSVCSSCGFAVEVLSGGLTLTAPYNRGLCIQMEDEEYLLSLLLADVELLIKCPSLPDVKPTTTTTTPPSYNGQVLQYPMYPQYPVVPQYPVFPEPTPPASTPAPTTVAPPPQRPQYPMYPQYPVVPQYPVFPEPTPPARTPAPATVAPPPQRPQLPPGAATDSNIENQEGLAAQDPAFLFMSPYRHFPPYTFYPRPALPTFTPLTANENTAAAPPAQLPQIPQSPQYQFPIFPQFPMAPGIFHPTTPPPPPATSTEPLVTTPAPATKHDGKPQVPQQPQLLMPPQYPLLQFPNLPEPPEGQTLAFPDPKPVIQQPKPYHVYPQAYQMPVLYPPPRYPSQRQTTQTAAPATTSTTSAATTLKPAAQQPFHYPHPYMPAYYVPQQAPVLVFPDPPTTPPVSSLNEHEHQPVYRAMPPFYPFPSPQNPKLAAKNW